MRAYSDSTEEAVRARELLKDWAGAGLITEAQYRRMEQETVCDVRRTNIFLRVVLFFFTLIIVGAAVALFFVMFFSRPDTETTGVFLLIFALASYAGMELIVSRARLYRYGIEEALSFCSVGFLCVGIELAFFSNSWFSGRSGVAEAVVPGAGVLASLWIWHRFGLVYAFPAAMIFVAWLSNYWTPLSWVHHLIAAGLYAGGLLIIGGVRSRPLVGFLNRRYEIAEALLWLGVYLAVNIKLSPLRLFEGLRLELGSAGVPKAFYWSMWVLIWCLPPAIIARGLRRRDRWVTAAGVLALILTLTTNKAYLGWQPHTWDAMVLGTMLVSGALWIRRWLDAGRDGVRHGFTARRLSSKDEEYRNVAATALGALSPEAVTIRPQKDTASFRFGGGDSGGGGATSDF